MEEYIENEEVMHEDYLGSQDDLNFFFK